MFIALAVVWATSVASAAEVEWPKDSASALSEFVTLQRFQIYADHCSENIPELKPEFDSVTENLSSHLQRISAGLLASDGFRSMTDKPVPAAIVFAFKDSFDDLRHNFERRDATSACPETLQKLGEVDDESLKSGLTESLTAIRNMIQNLEKEGGREAAMDAGS